MAFVTNTHSLTALEPIKLKYAYNGVEEPFHSKTYTYDNGFSFVEHTALSGYGDAAFSKNSCLLLTNVKSLKETIKLNVKRNLNFVGDEITNSSFYLKNKTGEYVRIYKNKLYIGGIGKKALFNIAVMVGNTIELKTSRNHNLVFDDLYPFELQCSDVPLAPEEFYKKRFEVDYFQGKLSLKCNTSEGSRFIGAGLDKQLKATGVQLNHTVVSPYYFYPEFLNSIIKELRTEKTLNLVEVKYFNQVETQTEKTSLDLNDIQENEANLLISSTTLDLSKNNTALANIAVLKSNFDSTGAYSTK